MKKILIMTVLLIICGISILLKANIDIKDEVYVVSKSEREDADTVKINNLNEVKESQNNIENQVNKNKITIYISGEIVNPGIVTIENDKRLYDAVEELGGTTNEADLNKINLAMKLDDEQHYVIPKIGEETINVLNSNIDKTQNNEVGRININTADIGQLDELPGVGEATANKIIKHREENGKFISVEEIKNVNGIGDKKYEEIKDLICTE